VAEFRAFCVELEAGAEGKLRRLEMVVCRQPKACQQKARGSQNEHAPSRIVETQHYFRHLEQIFGGFA
jgi:hypothetical protein